MIDCFATNCTIYSSTANYFKRFFFSSFLAEGSVSWATIPPFYRFVVRPLVHAVVRLTFFSFSFFFFFLLHIFHRSLHSLNARLMPGIRGLVEQEIYSLESEGRGWGREVMNRVRDEYLVYLHYSLFTVLFDTRTRGSPHWIMRPYLCKSTAINF